MSRATKRRQKDHAAREGGRHGHYRAAMLATGALVLVATGGVVSAQTNKPARHLLALGVPGQVGGVPPTTEPPRTPPPAKVPPATTTSTTTVPLPKLVSITPRPGTTGVAPSTAVKVVLSRAPRPGAPMPTLTPSVKGQWTIVGAVLTFRPSASYVRWATEKVTVPAALATSTKATPATSSFVVAGVPLLRIQQLLSELGYLPLRFGPPDHFDLDSEPTKAGRVPDAPRPGSFTWRYPNIPASLLSSWSAGQDNVLTQGAVMQFEAGENLNADGMAGPQVWKDLTAAVAARKTDPYPYDYLIVSEAVPEQLVVWRDGTNIYQTPVNTGVPGATTATGTFPVYERFQTTTMVGTDVDGTKYDVPNVPWVAYFNGGDAVHGYWRTYYGYPQSNGCVELPISNAQVVWSMDPIGTLVTVAG